MIRFLTISALSFALLPACSKKDDAATAPEAKTSEAPASESAGVPEPAPAAPVLVIKAATLKFELGDNNPDGAQSLSLEDNGSIVAKGETFGTLGTDGKLVDKDGKELASLAADGTLSTKGGGMGAIVIAENGSLSVAGEEMASFGDDNMLVLKKGGSEKVSFEGPDEAKRAMMVIFSVMMMTGDATQSATIEDSASADAPTEE